MCSSMRSPIQSDPDSQTDRHQARNTASGCNAAEFLHHNTGFAVRTADAALRPLDFAVQFVAFDVGYDFAVEADLVQVSAAVVQVADEAT